MNYKSLLYDIQQENTNNMGPTADTIIVPSNTRLYNVNLNTREIDAPEYLSVQHEHHAETVYFLVDRFYDSMDLAQTICVIQYTTNNENYIYVVPYCDTTTFPNQMVIPWCISGSATQFAGIVKYVMRFYLIDSKSVIDNDEYHPENAQFLYNLSTKPAQSRVMYGLPIDAVLNNEDYRIETNNRFYELMNSITQMVDNSTIYWTDV